MITPLLSTKLIIPYTTHKLVPRPHLIEQLEQGLQRKLTIIAAAGGYGKTTLLSSWLNERNSPTAWLTVDQNDNHLILFLRYLIAALQRIDPILGQDSLHLLTSPEERPTAFILTSLINQLHQYSNKVILVLDDYHFVENDSIHEAVAFLIENAPPQLHLVIATRHDLPFSLARLRGRGELQELNVSDLCFSHQEIQYFLDDFVKRDSAAIEIEKVDAYLEGWITGYQLLVQAASANKKFFGLESKNGHHPYLLEYLAEEVLETLPQYLQTFVLYTAVLDEFCRDLCICLIGKDYIAELEEMNLFIFPIDRGNGWYRYHALFKEFLYHRLKNSQPKIISELHGKAAHWFEENRLKLQAIHHALQAEDYDMAVRILEPELHFIWVRTEMPIILGWLEALPSEILYRKPQLCLTYAWGLTFADRYEEVEPYLHIAQQLIDEISKTQPPDRYLLDMQGQAKTLAIHLLAHQGHYQSAIEQSNMAIEALTEDQNFLKGVLHQRLGNYYQKLDQLSEALKAFEVAEQIFERMNNTCETLVSLIAMGNIQMEQGHLQDAEVTFLHLLEISDTWDGAMLSVVAEASLRLSQIYLGWKRFDKADGFSQQAIRQSETSGHAELKVESLLYSAILQETVGNSEGALEYIQMLLRLPKIHTYSEIFTAYKSTVGRLLQAAVVQDIEREVALSILAMLDSTAIVNSANSFNDLLTQRERDVLELVAAGLSNRAISEALVVTLGTTKKHLNNIFSKLNVKSRTQAVVRAKELSLL